MWKHSVKLMTRTITLGLALLSMVSVQASGHETNNSKATSAEQFAATFTFTDSKTDQFQAKHKAAIKKYTKANFKNLEFKKITALNEK